MRTAEEFHRRQVEYLALALKRPAMGCGTSRCCEAFYRNTLNDLCWLDERERELDAVAVLLLQGSMGVYGQFFYQHLAIPDDFINEIAGTYAQAAFRLGYFEPERLLSSDDFEEFRRRIDEAFLSVDHTEPELLARFGQPTHMVVGGQTTVHCYGCVDPEKDWLYLDFSRCYPPDDGRTYKWFDEPVLRDVRRTENRFELLPFAAWCRNAAALDGETDMQHAFRPEDP